MSIIKIILMIGICIINVNCHAQDSIAILEAKNWMDEAKTFSKNKEYILSDSLLVLSRAVFKSKKDWDNWFITVSRSNANAIKQRNYKSYLDSLSIFERNVPNDSAYIKARIYFFQGANHQLIGNNYEAIKLFKNTIKSLEQVQSIYGHLRFFNIYYKRALKNIANGYSKYNDQVSALKYIEEFEKFAADKRDSCYAIQLKGRYAFFNFENKKSYKYLKESILNCDDSDPQILLSSLLIRMDSINSSLKVIDQIALQHGENIDYHLAKSLYYESISNWELSILHQTIALKLIQADLSWGQRVISKESIVLAQLYFNKDEFEKAVNIAHSVLSYYDTGLDSSNISLRPQLDSSLPDIWLIEAYYIKAKYFRNLYEIENDEKYLEEATFYYQTLFDYFDQLKNEYYADNSKYRMGAYGQNIYNEIVDFYIELFEKNKNPKYLNSAFQLTQQSNAFVLKNAITERKMFELIDLSQDSIDLYLELTNKASLNSDSSNYDVLDQYDEFKSSLDSSYPALKKYNENGPLPIDDVQALIKNDDLLLQYQYSKSTINLFAISKSDVKVYVIETPSNFEAIVNQHTKLVSNPNNWNPDDFVENGNLLYNLLLGKVLSDSDFSNKEHLYIIPNGLLRNIAFSTLIKEKTNSLKANDYLIWDYSISYLYYCEQLQSKNNSKEDKTGFLGFGLRYEDKFLDEIKTSLKDQSIFDNSRSATLLPLRFAVDEVNKCAEYFNGKVYTNEGATLNTALSEISNYNLIHISAHALIDNDDYFKSHIIFNRDDDNEYKMTYQDVIRSNVNADFVVLSACQTGIGNLIYGEGLMSLCRAFVQSGTKAVMGAYWNASDKPSSELMQLFYQNLKMGKSKAKALQLAQKAYLTDDDISSPRVRAPFYWAPWVIYGENSPYQNESFSIGFGFKSFVVLIVLFLALFFTYYIKNRQVKL